MKNELAVAVAALSLIALVAIVGSAQAGEPFEGYSGQLPPAVPGCYSAEAYDEMYNFAVMNDNFGLRYLDDAGKCTVLQEGLQFSLIEASSHSTNMAKIRVYIDAFSMEVYVPGGALVADDLTTNF